MHQFGLEWDMEREEYSEPKRLPDGVIGYTDNMDDLTACANCGKMIPYGITYSSKRWFGLNGMFSFGVCEECYSKEIEQWKKLQK